jgi:hypothetical protein
LFPKLYAALIFLFLFLLRKKDNLNMKNKLTKIQESILVLSTLQALLDEYRICLTKEKDKSDSVIFSIITSQIIITTCSYLDEWEVLGNLIKEGESHRILTLRKIVKPAISRINKWTDMRQFRNNIIAHNHRIKKENNSFAILNIPRKLNCPNSFYDYILLMGCIFITKNVLLRMFQKEYNEALPIVKNIEDINPINEIKDEKSFKKELDLIRQNIEKSMETLL